MATGRRRETLAAVEPISPELVLVSPPESAAQARSLLPEPSFVHLFSPTERVSTRLGLGFLAFLAVCLGSTVGPIVLAFAAHAH